MYKSTPFLTSTIFFNVLIYETFGGERVAQRLPEEMKNYHKLQLCFGIKARYGLNNRTLSVCTTHMNVCILYFVLTDTFHHHLHPPPFFFIFIWAHKIWCFLNTFIVFQMAFLHLWKRWDVIWDSKLTFHWVLMVPFIFFFISIIEEQY